MKFIDTDIPDVYLISPEIYSDQRGGFFRAFCSREFEARGLEAQYVQSNISSNNDAGTIRGMHFQNKPNSEVKIVRCISGSVFDVVVDIRRSSPTYLKWFGAELTASNGLLMYVPKGFAHGYQTLTGGSALHYMVSNCYAPESESGVAFNDPAININWPLPPSVVSDKDMNWPLINA
jgi:dTDP-4-dehydrorhamnose 3,5-epimerase